MLCSLCAVVTSVLKHLFVFFVLPYILYTFFCVVQLPKTFGKYTQPGRWYSLKRALVWLWWYVKQKRLPNDGSIPSAKEPRLKPSSPCYKAEYPQKLACHPDAFDSVYVNGVDYKGNTLVARVSRRPGRIAEVWLMLRLGDGRYFHFPQFPDTTVCNTNDKDWTAGGLQFDILQSLFKWRITFNGLLREGHRNKWSEEVEGKLVHVKFAFVFTAFTGKFSYNTDVDAETVSDVIAREEWSGAYFDRLRKFNENSSRYDQWGMLLGSISVADEPELNLCLRGVRERMSGVLNWRKFERYIVNTGYAEDGCVFSITAACIPGIASHYVCGYVVLPSGQLCPLKTTDLHLSVLGELTAIPDKFSYNTIAGPGRRIFAIEVEKKLEQVLYTGNRWDVKLIEHLTNITINGVKGWGVTEYLYRSEEDCPVPIQKSLPMLTEPDVTDGSLFTLPFTDPACGASKLVGGKGTQLALLSQFKQKFCVPKGFCITVAAYKHHLEENQELVQFICQLHEVATKQRGGNLNEMSKKVSEMFQESSMSSVLKDALASEMEQQFGENWNHLKVAVRSSAVGEDSAEASFAGQMETFLGIVGLDKICNAVIKCWASQFAFPAVEYRRNHGQPVAADMGVCIQEMVDADSAGVLFTRDPVTGNPGIMTINVSYGLGEAVVSGIVEPDTITLERSFNNKLCVKDKVVGSKKAQLVLSESGGIKEVTTADEASYCCLSDKLALQLGEIGILIEQSFSDPRDIEFAAKDDKIYLLQARPITSFNMESDDELIHEFDGPVLMEQEMFTTANTGEMMPQAMTPLTVDIFIGTLGGIGQLEIQKMSAFLWPCHIPMGVPAQSYHFFINVISFQRRRIFGSVWPCYVPMILPAYCGHFFANCFLGLYYMNEYTMVGATVASSRVYMEMILFGRRLDDSIEDIIIHRFKDTYVPLWRKVRAWIHMMSLTLKGKGAVVSAKKLVSEMHLDVTQSDFWKLYRDMEGQITMGFFVWNDHMIATQASAMLSNILKSVILGSEIAEINADVMSDVAMILSSCPDVLSADVPAALKKLALDIVESGHDTHFRSLSPEKATEWLHSSESGELKDKFASFIKIHGHRCIREAELWEKPWRVVPEKVVRTLQEMTKDPSHLKQKKTVLSETEALAAIKTPVGRIAKVFLKFLLPYARAGVGQREQTKSLSIKAMDILRQGYTRLAEILVHEGILPEEELIFFLTHDEIAVLKKTRSARLIGKAFRRRKLMPTVMAMEFPEICYGYPKPEMEHITNEQIATTMELKGMPVSNGVVQGKCRVVKCLEDANSIQIGEILIAQYTDIGWSPYFPLISGLVTELGGLLSHGAVVAREYGLPCIVSAKKATSIFKTGEEVILNGTAGTIAKVANAQTQTLKTGSGGSATE